MPDNFIGISRSELSKLKILEAFESLVNELGAAGLTVNAICKRAGISRTTFYKNFESKYDISQWYFLRLANKHLLKVGTQLTWSEALTACYREVHGKRSFLARSSNMGGLESGLEYGLRVRLDTLGQTALQLIEDDVSDLPPGTDIPFQIAFFAHAENAMVRQWLSSTHPVNPDEFAAKVTSCIPTELKLLFDAGALRNREA